MERTSELVRGDRVGTGTPRRATSAVARSRSFFLTQGSFANSPASLAHEILTPNYSCMTLKISIALLRE